MVWHTYVPLKSAPAVGDLHLYLIYGSLGSLKSASPPLQLHLNFGLATSVAKGRIYVLHADVA